MAGRPTKSTLQQSPGQTDVEWKISNFWKQPFNLTSKTSTSSQADDSLSSPPFLLSDAEWFLKMYPNGQTVNDTEGWISMYLRKKKSTTEQRIAFRIGIKKNDGSELVAFQLKRTFEKNVCGWGWDKFVKLSSLLSLEDDASHGGSLSVFCTARILRTKEVPSLYGVMKLSENFKDLYFEKSYSDVTIFVTDKKFLAHRNVLASRSKVFASMFKHDTLEKTSGTVHIPDCDPDSFEEFLIYIYSGRGDVVSSRNALSLYETADKYDLKELREECAECLAREVSVDSLCDVVRLAAMHCESDLLEAATKFFIDKAETIMKTPKWQDFLAESPCLGNELFLKYLRSQQKSRGVSGGTAHT